MIVLKRLVTWGMQFLRYLLVNVLVGGILDVLIFNGVNQLIDDLFSGEDVTEDGTTGADAREDAHTRDGRDGRGPV